jgi:hypothetical protein
MNNALVIANVGVLVANLFLIYFIYRQVRHIYRPIITTKVISHEASVEDTPTTLVSGDPYLVVSNVSTNQATNLKIDYEFWLRGRRITKLDKTVRYLNPKEATKDLIPLGKILRDYPELFAEVEQGKETKKIPKKTLALYLKITIAHGFPRYKIVDSYKIEWGSLENYPRFEDHPVTHCWNIRDSLYIYKLSGARDTER